MQILLLLTLLFVLLPWLELYILFRLAAGIGLLDTFALVILTGVIGAGLARQQGAATLRSIQAEFSRGVIPAAQMFDGVLIFCAGLLLITPGIITDASGFLLLIPPARKIVRRGLTAYCRKRFNLTSLDDFRSGAGAAPAADPEIIDVEHRNLD